MAMRLLPLAAPPMTKCRSATHDEPGGAQERGDVDRGAEPARHAGIRVGRQAARHERRAAPLGQRAEKALAETFAAEEAVHVGADDTPVRAHRAVERALAARSHELGEG